MELKQLANASSNQIKDQIISIVTQPSPAKQITDKEKIIINSPKQTLAERIEFTNFKNQINLPKEKTMELEQSVEI